MGRFVSGGAAGNRRVPRVKVAESESTISLPELVAGAPWLTVLSLSSPGAVSLLTFVTAAGGGDENTHRLEVRMLIDGVVVQSYVGVAQSKCVVGYRSNFSGDTAFEDVAFNTLEAQVRSTTARAAGYFKLHNAYEVY